MKIALVEFQYHEVIMRTFSEIFRVLGLDVIPIISKGVHERLLLDNSFRELSCEILPYEYCSSSKRRPFAYIRSRWQLRNTINGLISIIQEHKPEIVIFNTVSSNIVAKELVRFMSKCTYNAGFVVSNLDRLFSKDNNQISKNYFAELVFKSSFVVLATEFERKKLANTFSDINTFILPIKVPSREDIDISRKIQNNSSSSNKLMILSVPGEVVGSRRDYMELFAALEMLLSDNVRFEVRLVGKLVDNEIFKWLKDNPRVAKHIKTFESFISEYTYSRLLMTSHYIVCPIPFDSKYGRYKMTGSIEDAICAGIPSILPDFYYNLVKEELMEASLVYSDSSKSLYKALIEAYRILNTFEYKKLKNLALCSQKKRYEQAIMYANEFISHFEKR